MFGIETENAINPDGKEICFHSDYRKCIVRTPFRADGDIYRVARVVRAVIDWRKMQRVISNSVNKTFSGTVKCAGGIGALASEPMRYYNERLSNSR